MTGEPPEEVGHGPLAGLFAYSLATPLGQDAVDEGFTIHGLVKRVVQREMMSTHREEALGEAIDWVTSVDPGHPADVRHWPRITPLVPHMLALAEAGETVKPEAVIVLLTLLDIHFDAKARHAEAEMASRRPLVLAEDYFGSDHPKVAIRLNNLAELLRDTPANTA